MRRGLPGLLGYVLCAVALTWPLCAHLGDAVIAHWDKDVADALWSIWWFGVALASPEHALFHTHLLHHPFGVSLEFGDLNLAVVAPAWALSKLFGLAAAYDLMLLAGFVLAATCTRALARRLCGDRAAAWFAGLAYAASPYWLATACNGWIFYAQTWVLPLALLALLRAAERRTLASWGLAGAALGLAFHVQPYYFLYVAVLLPLLALLHARAVAAWLRLRGGVLGPLVAAVVVLVVVLPRALPMYAVSGEEWVSHSGPLNTALAARPVEFVWPCRADVEARLKGVGYLVPYLGWTLLAAALAALLARDARRRAAPWLVTAGVMLVLALGPFAGEGEQVRLPGWWLQHLPGFRFLTNHWRWSLPAVLCLSVAAAMGIAAARGGAATDGSAVARRWRWLVPALSALLLSEVVLVAPLPLAKPLLSVRPTAAARLVRDEPGVHAVLDLGAAPKLNQIVHGKPIVGGWVARLPADVAAKSDELLRGFFALRDPQAAYEYLAERGIDGVITGDGQAVVIERGGDGQWRNRVLHE